MEAYLNKGIKPIIDQFPEVGNILDEYDIGCAPCNVGTCLLKDIVEIHSLPADKELEMMARISGVIYPGREIEPPRIKRDKEAVNKEISYSPPMKRLVDEHVLIKRWVALIPEVLKDLDIESEDGIQLILDGVDFIRSYADRYHHGKEEEILFKYFDEDLDIIKAMHEDHERARAHVRAILEAIDRKDKDSIVENLSKYGEILNEHIKKEDEILYPWMDRNLNVSQVGEMFSKFNEADDNIGYSPERYLAFIEKLEAKY
jgi:hemerythrin-like domain-containing protein